MSDADIALLREVLERIPRPMGQADDLLALATLESTIQSLTEDNAELHRIAEQATERGMEYLEERDALRQKHLETTWDCPNCGKTVHVRWKNENDELESTLQSLTEERDALAEQLALHVEREREALQTQALDPWNAQLQSTVDTLRAALEEIAGLVAGQEGRTAQTMMMHGFSPVKALGEARDIARTALSTTEDREPE